MSNLFEDYASEEEVSTATGKDKRTLRLRRQQRQGPPWVKFGQSIYYPRDKFKEWLDRQVIDPERKTGRAA